MENIKIMNNFNEWTASGIFVIKGNKCLLGVMKGKGGLPEGTLCDFGGKRAENKDKNKDKKFTEDDPKVTALRECLEESGITEEALEFVGEPLYDIKSKYYMYFAKLDKNFKLNYNPDNHEIKEIKCFTGAEVKEGIRLNFKGFHPRLLIRGLQTKIFKVLEPTKKRKNECMETEVSASVIAARFGVVPEIGVPAEEVKQAEDVEMDQRVVKTQLVCISRLKALAETLDKDSNEYKAALKVITATINRRTAWPELGPEMEGQEVGEIEVKYFEESIGPQRRYARPYVELFSLDKQSGLRGAAAHGLYIDFDLEGAYQVILQALCRKNVIDCPELDEHLKNREAQLAEVGALVPGVRSRQRKAAKEYFNAVYNGAGELFERTWAKEYGVANSEEFPLCARRFKKEMLEVSVALIEKYPDVEAEVKEKYPQKRPNSVIFYILSKEERKAIDAMERELTILNLRMDSYQGDGGFVRAEDIIRSDAFKTDAELEVLLTEVVRKVTDMHHTVKIKEIVLPRIPSKLSLEFKIKTITNTKNDADFPEYIETINRHFVQIREMKDTILQLRYDENGIIVNIGYMDSRSVKTNFHGILVVKETYEDEESGKKDDVECDIITEWFSHPDRRQARRLVFEPRPGAYVDPEDFNLFQGLPFDTDFRAREAEFRERITKTNFDLEEIETGPNQLSEGAQYLLRLIRDILADGNDERDKSIRRWINRCLVTRTKTKHLPAFIGEQGSYKSVFFGDGGLFYKWYGAYYVKFTNIDNMLRNFNAELSQALFVWLEEAKPYRKSHTNSDILKDFVDASRVRIEKKGVDAFFVDSHANTGLGSNSEDPLKVEDSNRRYTLHATSNVWSQKRVITGELAEQTKNDHDNKVWGYVEDDSVVLELYAYFMLYHELVEPGDWLNYQLKPVKTKLGDEQMEHNKCPIGRWVREWRDGEVDMFIEEMAGGRDKDRPELQERQTTVAQWGREYKAGEMFNIWMYYRKTYASDERNYADNVSFGIALSKKTEFVEKKTNPPRYQTIESAQ